MWGELEHASAFAEARKTCCGARGVVSWPLTLEVVLAVRFAEMVGTQRALFSAHSLDLSSCGNEQIWCSQSQQCTCKGEGKK